MEEWTRTSRDSGGDPTKPGPFVAAHGASYFGSGTSWTPSGWSVDVADVTAYIGFRCVGDAAVSAGEVAAAVAVNRDPKRETSRKVGPCAAPLRQCDGTCVDLERDNGNCGGCGAACDGTCFDGRCVSTFASLHTPVSGVATNGTDVFWGVISPPSIMKRSVRGGEATVVIATQPGSSLGPFSVDATHVFWSERADKHHQTLQMLPLDGGERVTLATSAAPIGAVAVDATHVFWTTEDDSMSMRVIEVSRSGGTPGLVATLPSIGASGIALDEARVYAMSWTAMPHASGPVYSLVAAPKRGGTAVTLRDLGVRGAGAIAVDGEAIYWSVSDGDGGSGIVREAKRGGKDVTLASGQNGVGSVAVDRASVYWTVVGECRSPNDCDSAIMRSALKR